MDSNHFTPFGARVEPPPVIPIEQMQRVPYKTMALICSLSWALAILAIINVGAQSYRALASYEQQLAWDDRR
ncbi:hypothetical protein [Rhizobium etli]|nr:hypothetical protein [Rhizobium etli]